MQSAFEILHAPKSQPLFKRASPRDVVIRDIYNIYTSEKQRILRKKFNWKKYIQWLRENRIKHSKVSLEKFKKSKQFTKELPIETIAIFLARYKVDRLYQILSEAKDLDSRGGSAGAFIVSSRFI